MEVFGVCYKEYRGESAYERAIRVGQTSNIMAGDDGGRAKSFP